MNSNQRANFGMSHMTPVVKKLILINLGIWFVFQLILEGYFLSSPIFSTWLNFSPETVSKGHLWRPFTYMFLHSDSIMHVFFNMFILWWAGSEVEAKIGSPRFLKYYIFCGIGGAFIYYLCHLLYRIFVGESLGWSIPVIGASGAVFGVLLAYGILFAEKTIYLFFAISLKAKYLIVIFCAIEFASLLQKGASSNVASLAHLGGLLSGLLFFIFFLNWRPGPPKKNNSKSRRKGKLKLVINNKENKDKDPKEPKYWN